MNQGSVPLFPLLIAVAGVIFAVAAIFYCVIPMHNAVDEFKDSLEYHPIDRIDKTPIVALKDGTHTQGYGYMFGSKINGVEVYIYYTQRADGGKIRHNVNADQCIIYETENENPYIISHYVETNRLHRQMIKTYSIYVPNGTVPNIYNVV